MAQYAHGWTIRWKDGIASVRFRHAGKRYAISTGERDSATAQAAAERIYLEVLQGAGKASEGYVSTQPMHEVAAGWIASCESTHTEGTRLRFEIHARYWIEHFYDSLARVTERTIAEYTQKRLLAVTRSTVSKERHNLTTFLRWCKLTQAIATMPDVPAIPAKALGNHDNHRRPTVRLLTRDEVAKLLAALPEQTRLKTPVRAYFVVCYETGLRPGTVRALSRPEHWDPARPHELRITAGIDKSRYARTVPITPAAAEALATGAKVGAIFPVANLKRHWSAAIKATGIDCDPYDLRHSRATHLLAAGASLPGASYLLGHRQQTTTAIYLHGDSAAAAEAIGAIRGQTAKSPATDEGARLAKGLVFQPISVGAIGIEPTTLTVSSEKTTEKQAYFEKHDMQKTAENCMIENQSGPMAPGAFGSGLAVYDWADRWVLQHGREDIN